MRFIHNRSGWELVSGDGLVLATLRSDVEVLALRQFCASYVANPAAAVRPFTVEHGGVCHAVTPLGGPGDCLAFRIAGPDGRCSTVETLLVLARHDFPAGSS